VTDGAEAEAEEGSLDPMDSMESTELTDGVEDSR